MNEFEFERMLLERAEDIAAQRETARITVANEAMTVVAKNEQKSQEALEIQRQINNANSRIAHVAKTLSIVLLDKGIFPVQIFSYKTDEMEDKVRYYRRRDFLGTLGIGTKKYIEKVPVYTSERGWDLSTGSYTSVGSAGLWGHGEVLSSNGTVLSTTGSIPIESSGIGLTKSGLLIRWTGSRANAELDLRVRSSTVDLDDLVEREQNTILEQGARLLAAEP